MNTSHHSQLKLDLLENQHIELRSRTNIRPGMLKECKRAYVRINPKIKEQLYELVLTRGLKIVQVAQMLNIKYATAKTIIFHMRRQRKQNKIEGTKQCEVRKLMNNQIQKITIISKTSSKIVTVQDHQFLSLDPLNKPINSVSSISIKVQDCQI